jgi:hypothetical protein
MISLIRKLIHKPQSEGRGSFNRLQSEHYHPLPEAVALQIPATSLLHGYFENLIGYLNVVDATDEFGH